MGFYDVIDEKLETERQHGIVCEARNHTQEQQGCLPFVGMQTNKHTPQEFNHLSHPGYSTFKPDYIIPQDVSFSRLPLL
jgi:hypothetical protein